jgi:hypothetical protein
VPRLAVLMLVLGLVAGCGSSDRPPAAHTTQTTPTASGTPTVQTGRHCDGVHYAEVLGRPPAYGGRKLRRYPASRYACRAMWLPHLESWYVPQAIALDGDTAWVSGYTWHRNVADRACRLLHVRLSTGKVLADQGLLVGSPGGRKPTFCRHGGGLVRDRHGLWVAEKERLWLVDPARVGSRARSVVRVWAIRKPVYGSSAVLRNGGIGLVHFRRAPQGRISWFRIDDLLRAGVHDLVGKATDASQVAPYTTAQVPGAVQGMTYRPGHPGLLVSAYRRGCGVLIQPDRSAIDVMPGIEDFEFTRGNRLWVVSESSSRIYQRKGGAVTPMLTEYDAGKVMGLPKGHGCG